MQKNTLSPLENTVLDTLTKQGYVIRSHGQYSLEVWGKNLNDHFVLTYDANQHDLVDVVYLDSQYSQYSS